VDEIKKERILIIGENEETREALSCCLNNEYFLDASPSFEGAMNMIEKESYNVVIAEMDLPGAKGIEVLHKLKKIKSEIPVIVITTHSSIPLAVKAMKAGAYDYITTPFNLEELKIVVFHASEWRKMVEEVKEKRIFQELAIIDGLTQIYNRRYFDELLRRESDRAIRYHNKFSLLMIDIDDFKKYNDIYGHQAGDEALRVAANSIINQTRSTDFAARYGGEEFAIIAPHTDKKQASFLATRLSRFVADQDIVLRDSRKTRLSVSVGIATFGEDTSVKDELVKLADDALYQAKKLGKNRVCMFGAIPR
jgi:two-component system cell cycle response regulator